MRILPILAASVAVGAIAVPAAAQSAYSYQSYPVQQQQSYPGYQQSYPQQGYGYANQNQTGASVIGQLVDSLLGNRYSVSDRTAVSQCANAAMAQAAARYGNGTAYGNNGYGNGYANAYGQQQRYGYNPASTMRVTAITNVERRQRGLRVTGTMSTGASAYAGQYGYQNGYQNRAYGGTNVMFRCNVDERGQVTKVRIGDNANYRR